jgi:hypothetical protein
MEWFIGLTGKSFIDVWTLPHLGFWVFVGSTLWAFKLKSFTVFSICLALSYAWEIFERFAEVKWPDKWLSPESWLNSYISDPLTCVIGVLGIWILLNKSRKQAK